MAAQTIVAPKPLIMARTTPARPAVQQQPATPPHIDRLDSWKEIAVFLKRGVRTVQRWERTEALPVRRHQHAKLGSVYALKSEVAAWWESRGTQFQPAPAAAGGTARRRAEDDLRRRLLVLPFANLSGDAQQDYLSEGLTEEMITGLARLEPARLSVIARTTALSYKSGAKRADQIAAELDLDYILEGSVRASGGRIRVTAQLVDAREHTHLWAQNYDRNLRDVLEVQADVAAAIGREVRLAIAPAEQGASAASRAVDAETYQAYLMGRYLLNQMTAASLGQSLEWFARAIARAQSLGTAHALSYAGMAQAYGLLATVPFDALPAHEAMPKAAVAARQALELDPSLPEAHAALGLVLHHYEWNWPEAEKAYQRALELNPDYTAALLRYAWLLLALGRSDEALSKIARAQEIAEEIDPHLLVVVRATRASALYFARKFDAVIAECREALKLDPRFYLLHYLVSRALARMGRRTAAVAALAKTRLVWKDLPLVAAGAGLAYAIAGRKAEATRILRRLEEQRKRRNIPATYIGTVYAGLGDFDAAFAWLERAFQERADGLTLLNAEPLGERFRSDPRFASLVRRMGLLR